jgi:hypothetical protein
VAIESVAFSPDGRILAAGSEDDNVWLWKLTDPGRPTQIGQPLTGPTDSVRSVTFSPDGQNGQFCAPPTGQPKETVPVRTADRANVEVAVRNGLAAIVIPRLRLSAWRLKQPGGIAVSRCRFTGRRPVRCGAAATSQIRTVPGAGRHRGQH